MTNSEENTANTPEKGTFTYSDLDLFSDKARATTPGKPRIGVK